MALASPPQRTASNSLPPSALCGDTLCSGRGGAELECGGVDQERPGSELGAISGAVAASWRYSGGRIVGPCRRWQSVLSPGRLLLDGNESEAISGMMTRWMLSASTGRAAQLERCYRRLRSTV